MNGSKLVTRRVAAINHGPRRGGCRPDMVIIHYTGTVSAERACTWLTCAHSQVSCHYLIDEAGEVVQLVDEHRRAWHAGKAAWGGQDDINSCSIGIELQNPGHEYGYPDFPARQMESVIALAGDICQRHDIEPRRVLGHSDVAPGRKIDPGEKFDWRALWEAGVGHWCEPAEIGGDDGLGAGDRGSDVKAMQQGLAAYGYDIAPTGVYDGRTTAVVAAFQRHFRPGLVNGRADASTVATLKRLLRSLHD